MNKKITLGLFAALAFQFFIMTGVYVNAAIPLWAGKEIRLRTTPVDPRSLFRGNYAQLAYEISRIDSRVFPQNADLRIGEVVYIILTPAESGDLYAFSSASLQKPESGVFIRGRIQRRVERGEYEQFRIRYGVEAFFAPKERALALEESLGEGGIALLRVSDTGKARLVNIVAQ